MNALPAVLMECKTDRVDDRVLGTYINIQASLNMAQCPPKHDVFKILSVRSDIHAADFMGQELDMPALRAAAL